MKTLLLSFFILFAYLSWGQNNLNDYKYIIVPKKFDGFKNENEHQTSTLISHLFSQKGFTTVYDDALPDDLNKNRCLGLKASLNDNSSMFSTKTKIALKDCNGEEVFETMEGKSRIKDYKESYGEAIRLAMNSFNAIDYTYKGNNQNAEPITVSFRNDSKGLEEEVSEASTTSKEKKKEKAKARRPKNVNPMVTQEATAERQLYKNREPVVMEAERVGNKEMKKHAPKKINNDDVWYAQSISNGYQLVDSSPKIRMKLLKSSSDNVYMAQTDDKSGMVYQKEGKWVFEYYEGDKLVQEELNIKF